MEAAADDNCFEYFEVGARVSPRAIYSTSQGGCDEMDPVDGEEYYEVHPLPDSEMPVVERYVE